MLGQVTLAAIRVMAASPASLKPIVYDNLEALVQAATDIHRLTHCVVVPMGIRSADFILVRGDDLIGNTIELITHSPYSHVAGQIKSNEFIEAQAFRKMGYQGLDFLIRKRKMA